MRVGRKENHTESMQMGLRRSVWFNSTPKWYRRMLFAEDIHRSPSQTEEEYEIYIDKICRERWRALTDEEKDWYIKNKTKYNGIERALDIGKNI